MAHPLDKYAHIVGVIPDSLVGELTGIGQYSVYNYRRRRDIPTSPSCHEILVAILRGEMDPPRLNADSAACEVHHAHSGHSSDSLGAEDTFYL